MSDEIWDIPKKTFWCLVGAAGGALLALILAIVAIKQAGDAYQFTAETRSFMNKRAQWALDQANEHIEKEAKPLRVAMAALEEENQTLKVKLAKAERDISEAEDRLVRTVAEQVDRKLSTQLGRVQSAHEQEIKSVRQSIQEGDRELSTAVKGLKASVQSIFDRLDARR